MFSESSMFYNSAGLLPLDFSDEIINVSDGNGDLGRVGQISTYSMKLAPFQQKTAIGVTPLPTYSPWYKKTPVLIGGGLALLGVTYLLVRKFRKG